MDIRKATRKDVEAISKIKRETILKVNSKDYNKQQVTAWADFNTSEKIEKRFDNVITFVGIENSDIVGVITFNLKSHEVGSLFVKYDRIGKGIGSKLLSHVENNALKLGIKNVKTHASLTAYKFYEKRGYKKIKETFDDLGTSNIRIPDILMTKRLKE